MRYTTLSKRWTILLAAAAVLAGGLARADVYDDLVTIEWAGIRPIQAAIETQIREAQTPEARRAVEDKLVRALKNPRATYECKQAVCRLLRRVGTERCVPTVAKLLTDEKLSHMARFALQYMAAPAAGQALRDALIKTRGDLKIGVITSLGENGDPKSAPALAKLAGGRDLDLARVAIRALARTGGRAAADALAKVTPPRALKQAWADASLRCADDLRDDGDTADAVVVYKRLYAAGQPEPIRIAALRGLALAQGPDAVGMLVGLLKDGKGDLGLAARRFLMEAPGAAVTKAIASRAASAPSSTAVDLLVILTERADTAAAPAVTRLAEKGDEAVRVAAIQALAVLGDAGSVPVLAKAVAAGGPVRDAAVATLNRIRGEGVGEAIARLLGSSDAAVRAGIVEVLATRADKSMVPAMLKAARDKDGDVRASAIKGLEAAAGADELPELVGLLTRAEDGSERGALEKALAAAIARTEETEACAAPLVAGLAKANADAKSRLLRLLGRVGGAKALAAVRGAIRDASADVATAAVRALAGWPDASPAPDLLKVIQTSDDRTRKALAFRGYVQMANMPGVGGDEATRMYKRALALAATPAEKKSVLAGLAGSHVPEALGIVKGLLADTAVKAEAELALVQVAGNVRDADPAAARAALEQAVKATKNDAVRKKARGILNEMDKYRGYVTSWLLAGPYTKGSPFDTKYAPEQAGADVAWKAATKGVGPQIIDLAKIFGGSDRAVYAKATLYSPKDQDVGLELGSDDGIKVWVGGKLVHANNASRGCTPGQDKAKAHLKQGWNPVLVKIAQGGGDWAFAFRVVKPDGSPLEGMKVGLEKP
ncbi:MAG: HEAT repeat domain-containing protein [Planctomycetota bacterium]|nr:HEAT repeat domain-containing protein [Planctomycetota bacterium]